MNHSHSKRIKKQDLKVMEHTPLYSFDHLFRRVEPYDFTFKAFAKGRWLKKTILSVFTSEFGGRSDAYYEKMIEQGHIQVNGQTVLKDYLIQNSDIITHTVHRHEPPVSCTPIEIISDTNDYLVVNKPASLPAHPTGRYQYNTLKSILQYEMGYNQQLYFINRIDRLTSGIVILAKNKQAAHAKLEEMTSRKIKKKYLCRVRGEFPLEAECHEPLKIFAHRLGINHVSQDGKPCSTLFKRIHFNGRTSLIEAFPITGRTHQIRVHLQFLGYPIANDPLYASELWDPFQGGQGGMTCEDLKKVTHALADKLNQTIPPDAQGCVDCEMPPKDPHPDELLIWLHSIEYQGQDWKYETREPFWAHKDFQGDELVRFASLEE